MNNYDLSFTRRVALPRDVYDIICCLGDFNTVVNNIIDLYEEEAIPVDVENLPKYPNRRDGTYKIRIHNPWYEEMLEYYGNTSRRYSLRRMLCYFVYEEYYNEFDVCGKSTELKSSEGIKRLNYEVERLQKLFDRDNINADPKIWRKLNTAIAALRRTYEQQVQQTNQSQADIT